MRLLIVGNIDSHISLASKIAKERGASVTHAQNIDTALQQLCSGSGADLLMIDVRLDIKALIQSLERERIHLPVVGYGFDADADAAVRAIKAGAKEYVPLPPDEDLIAALLASIAEDAQTIIHSGETMKRLIVLADQVAPSDASVLITGESGTGKEVMARYLHAKSRRATGPFISLNCAAIPENLLESELFGHEKGSFTGALSRRIGKFEEADGGTLLLDEISEMDARLQAKLLRALQEREIDRVGGSKPVKVNIRILATSNRDLQKEVQAGKFREDLLYRLNVITIHLPPLRERKEDIPLFAKHFAEKYAAANGFPTKALTAEALKKMTGHRWPGNVRELENTIHRATLLAVGKAIDVDAIILPQGAVKEDTAAGNEQPALIGRTVESVERELIMETLEHCLGNRTHAANMLGISIRTLRNKLKQYEDGEELSTMSGQG